MPNPLISDKNKGKSFAAISEDIQKKYQDRYDPISQRGLMAEMNTLKEEQEYQKAKKLIQEQLQQQLTQPQQQVDPMQQVPIQMGPNNQGAVPDMPIQESQGHKASQSYNENFAYGGKMKKYANGGWDGLNESLDMNLINQQVDAAINPKNTGQAEQGVNPMRYAPLAGNLYNILSSRRPQSNKAQMEAMGYETSVDPALATRTNPRQTQFNRVDLSGVERAIQNQARGFTGQNINTSNGNAGAFMANELANQGNVMNSIAQARMQQQQSNQQTTAMNAQEQARIDQFKQAQAGMEAGIRGQNLQTGMQLADLDARDRGAYSSNMSANVNALAQNFGNIGREQDTMDMIANSLGYNSFGQYMNNLSPDKQKGILDMIFKSRKK